jgi:DNA-binding HxlR family transcriptional regulator
MPRTPFSELTCSIGRTLDVIGDAWTPMVLRDVAMGISRFDAIQRNLEISRKVLTERLQALIEHGVLERVAYQDNPPRYDYVLTEKGVDLAMVLLAMQAWGDKWVFAQDGPPLLWRHLGCDQLTNPVIACDHCHEPLQAGEIEPLVGPGFDPERNGSEIPAAIARRQSLIALARGAGR